MGTVVTFHVVGHGETHGRRRAREAAVARAVRWFECIERDCSRFEPDSVISKLALAPGVPTRVDSLVFEAVRFAVAVAEDTGGAFDPTVGLALERCGFDEAHRTGERVRTVLPSPPGGDAHRPSYRDVQLDANERTIMLAAPLLLDLGAVAKGLAVDMAMRELQPFEDFVIDAGGDLYVGGRNAADQPWSIGVRHPRDEHRLIETLRVSNAAVCTSGDYERGIRDDDGRPIHHIFDARSEAPASLIASATVVADSAMVADALSTAAFVLGPTLGIQLLEGHGVDGVLWTSSLERVATRGMRADIVRAAPPSATLAAIA
jgi:thiamine biosynthesis lipoprotein